MLPSKARWSIVEADMEAATMLVEALGVPPIVARLLAARGWTHPDDAARFLMGGTDLVHDPFLLDDMRPAVERIHSALAAKEKIRIYGDYDADGVSSTSLMIHLLRHFGARFDYYIPHRVQEGYGLNCPALDKAREEEVSLIITVDTGISAVEEIAYARSLGIDVVVTDHHEPPEALPEAYALINPKKPGCSYPFKQLAGVGVALKLAQALLGRWPEELLEYAVIGTVADLMPLTGENRVIVKQGLERMKTTESPGLKALFKISGISAREVNAGHIGFSIGPRINASGRLESAEAAVRLLTTDERAEAERIAQELDELNRERQRIVEEITKQAVRMLEERTNNGEPPKAIVLAGDEWNVGVIGIVASKLVERYYRPTIVLGIDSETGKAKGSARSIAGFDMYRALTHCDDLLEHFGGHPMAAGMTLAKEQVPELQRRMERLAEEWLLPDDYIPQLRADIVCGLEEVGIETIRQLDKLAPFGIGNPSPRFVFKGLALNEARTMGKEQKHLKLSLRAAEREAAAAVDAVGFGKGELFEQISPSAQLDVLGELTVNEWNGVQKPQIMLHDLSISHVQVFDWRGHPRPERKLEEWRSRTGGKARIDENGGSCPVVLLFGSDAPVPGTGLNMAVWRLIEGEPPRALNREAERQPLHQAEDIVLYGLPESMEQLRELNGMAAAVKRYYALFADSAAGQEGSASMPSRDTFKSVYAAVASLDSSDSPAVRPGAYVSAVARKAGISPQTTIFILGVFEELELIHKLPEQDKYRIVPTRVKKELASSRLYQRRLKRSEAESRLLYSSAKELAELLTAKDMPWSAPSIQQSIRRNGV